MNTPFSKSLSMDKVDFSSNFTVIIPSYETMCQIQMNIFRSRQFVLMLYPKSVVLSHFYLLNKKHEK